MKLLFGLLITLLSVNAFATIEGPSCGDLTKAQQQLLQNAAKSYVLKTYKQGMQVRTLQLSSYDCHDYDGVHSASEYSATWTKVSRGKQLECTLVVDVSVLYEGKKKVIDKKSEFEFEESEELTCEKK